ncbi:hypothetical protein OC861_004853 [Tilletia horrida]|nr:hypothetical protein OC861_004853 [Tilletia horrida]
MELTAFVLLLSSPGEMQELADLNTNPLDGISVEVSDENIYKWTAVINGPVSSSMIIDSRCGDQMPKYPFKTPKVKFLTPIHHPNVDDSGTETYKSDRALFDKQAAEHTKKHAMGK